MLIRTHYIYKNKISIPIGHKEVPFGIVSLSVSLSFVCYNHVFIASIMMRTACRVQLTTTDGGHKEVPLVSQSFDILYLFTYDVAVSDLKPRSCFRFQTRLPQSIKTFVTLLKHWLVQGLRLNQ